MSVDVATLVFEFKSDSATQAEQRMDALIAKGERLEAAAKRVTLATERTNEAHKGAAGAAERATQGAASMTRAAEREAAAWARAEAALVRRNAAFRGDLALADARASEKAAGAEAAAWAKVEAALEKRNAAFRGDFAAKSAREAVKAADAEAAALADLERRTAKLKASVDPLAAAQDRLNQELREADKLFAAGAISGGEYGRAVNVLNGRLGALNVVHQTAAKGARLQAHELTNLGAQFADIGVSLASGQALWLVAIQQGAQIGAIWGEASARGASLGATIKQVTASVLGFVRGMAPFLAIVGVVGGAFLLWRKYLDDTKAALAATAQATKVFAEVQTQARDALSSAVDFTDKYSVANQGLTVALDAVLVSQNSAYAATMAGVDANDAASRAGIRRAEIERLTTVAILKRAAAEATARAAESDKAIKQSQSVARRAGLVAAIGLGGMPDAISAGQQAQAEKFRALGGVEAQKAAAQERAYAQALNASADALMNAKLIIPEVTKATNAHGAAAAKAAKAIHEQGNATDTLQQDLQQVLQGLETANERAVREANERMLVLKRGLDAGLISVDEYREAIDRLFPAVVDVNKAQKAWNVDITDTVALLHDAALALDSQSWIGRMASDFEEARRKADDIAYAVDDIYYGIKNRDWASAFSGLFRALDQVQVAFSNTGTMADKVGAIAGVGNAVGNAIGGRAGRALSSAATMGQTAFMLTGNPIIAAAAAAAAGLTELLKGKPSNHGAGLDLTTGAFSGGRRNTETEQAARTAGDAILQGEQLLREAGLTLGATVHGLVIGTRDLSQIYLTNGRTVTAAVGDAAAAAEAGLRAMLEDATFASEAQEKLVRSMLAAGKGFDDISAALQTYAAAQKLASNVDDQILQLTDPKAYDLMGVTRDIEEQRKAAKALADQGYLTADQLAELTAKLATLEGLQTKDVLERYGAANDNALDSAKDALMNAYGAFVQAKQAEIAAARQTADALRSFRQQLDFGSIAGRDPLSQYAATKREFDRLNALAANDPERVANLQAVGQAFVEASRVASPTQLAFEKDLNAVRRATEMSQTAAEHQADLAQAQLDAATAQLEALGLLNATTMSMEQALKAYLAAVAAGKAANDNALDVTRYLAANPDLAENWASNGILRQLGSTLEEAARAHYDRTGRMEIEAGTRMRGYAAGGDDHLGGFRLVGEEGPEVEATGPARYYSATQTARMLGGDTARLEALVEGLTEEVAQLRKDQSEANRKLTTNTKDSADILAKVTQGGDALRTQDAA